MKHLTTILAAGALVLGGCANTSETDDGGSDKAVAGAIIGGILGGVAAHNTGDSSSRTRTAVGVAAGAAAGGLIGNAMDKKEAELKRIASERNAKEMEVERVREDLLKVSVSSEASFDFNSSSLKPEFKPTLDKIADVLYRDPNQRIQVIGHTDSKGSEAYNQQLSERRARATADYLIKQGVASTQISVEGRGELEPRADNSTADGRAQNRRVEIYLQQL